MKYIFSLLTVVLLVGFLPIKSYAYTVEDVEKHNTRADCWVVFESKVYDLSKYINNHDRYLELDEWCGKNMTEDFKNKAGVGRDHRPGSYSLLEQYMIGDITVAVVDEGNGITEVKEDKEEKSIDRKNPYNLIVPLLLSSFLYWITYFVFKKQRRRFNAFWNTALILLFLIPSFGFGVFMILQYGFPNLRDVKLDVMYWHVELSTVAGVIGISHFIQRLPIYLLQLSSKKEKVEC